MAIGNTVGCDCIALAFRCHPLANFHLANFHFLTIYYNTGCLRRHPVYFC
jgi:hypothetical protein